MDALTIANTLFQLIQNGELKPDASVRMVDHPDPNCHIIVPERDQILISKRLPSDEQ